jgi:hypothetical protein
VPLTYQPVDLPLSRGYNSRADAKVMEPVHLTDLQNGVLDKPGAVRKREGYTQLGSDRIGTGGVLSRVRGVYSHGDSLLAAIHTANGQDKLCQYSPQLSAWSDISSYVGWGVRDTVEVNNSLTYASSLPGTVEISADAAEANGLRVVAWYINDYSTGRGVWYQITEVSSGTVVKAPTKKTAITASATVKVRVLTNGGNVYVVYPNVDNGKVECFKIDTSSVANLETSMAAAVTASTHTDFGSAVVGFDAHMPHEGADYIVYAHGVTGTSPKSLRVGFISATDGSFGNTGTVRTNLTRNTKPVAVFSNSDMSSNVALFCIDSSGRLGYSMFDESASETANGTVNDSDVTYYACSGAWLADDSGWNAIWQGNTNTATAAAAFQIRTAVHASDGTQTTAPATKRYNSLLVGGLFNMYDDFYYLACPNPAGAAATTSDTSEYSIIMAGFTDHKPVGMLQRGTAFGPRVQTTRVFGSSGTNPYGYFAACDAAGAIHFVKFGYNSALPFFNATHHSANVNGSLYLGGAMTYEFDGASLSENGFLHTPGMAGASSAYVTQGTSGLLTQTGVYKYRVYYEYTDHLNRRVQSGFPYEFSVTLTGSNDDVTLTIPTLQWTRREGAGVRIAVYRTENGGDTYYRLDSVRNNPDAATVTVVDTLADSAITDNEEDYQNTGELDNLPFPATLGMASAQDRLIGISAENQRRLVYSKPLDGDGSVEFNDGGYIEFPEILNAVATAGGTIYAFAENTVYAITGEGPDVTGTVGSYSSPIVVARNVGVKNPKAVCEVPSGVLFVGDQGVWLISADGVKSVGDVLTKEDSTLIPQLQVRSINVLPDSSRVRIVASNASTTNCVLDWDYEFREWSRHTLAGTDRNVGATVVGGAYYLAQYSTGGSGIFKFTSRTDTAVFTDNGTGIAMLLKTAWIRPTGSAIANSRATHGYLLGKDMGHGHSVTVEVAYDYDETFTTIGTFAATGLPHIRFHLPRISFRAIMFRITEVPDGTPGEGIELSALGLELAMEGTTGGRLLDT